MKQNPNLNIKNIKLIIFGATGKTGTRLVQASLEQGLQTTAFVRNREKLVFQLANKIPNNLNIIAGDIYDKKAVASAIRGHDALVNAAAHAQDGEMFHKIFKTVVEQADLHLNTPKRAWFFGGIPALDFPYTKTMCLDLPFFPKFFKVHKKNLALLKNSNLDWSFMCPGPMIAEEQPGNKEFKVTTDTAPLKVNRLVRLIPKLFYSPIFAAKVSQTVIDYESVANFIINNLDKNGPYLKKRVGVAFKNMTNDKKKNGS